MKSIIYSLLSDSPGSQWQPAPPPHPADDPWSALEKTHSTESHILPTRLAAETQSEAECPPATEELAQSDWVRAKRARVHDGARDPDWPVAESSCYGMRGQHPG